MENYYWYTEESHWDNNETLNNYLNNEIEFHLCSGFSIEEIGDNEAVISIDGNKYFITACGNGDSFSHCVEFSEIEE